MQAQRDAVAYHLHFAHGADRLLQLFKLPADGRPKWYAAAGYPILDVPLGRRGLTPPAPMGGATKVPSAAADRSLRTKACARVCTTCSRSRTARGRAGDWDILSSA